MADYVADALHDATLEQIAEELTARYGCVLVGCHNAEQGTVMLKRGDSTTVWGIHQELWFFLKEKWLVDPIRDYGEGS